MEALILTLFFIGIIWLVIVFLTRIGSFCKEKVNLFFIHKTKELLIHNGGYEYIQNFVTRFKDNYSEDEVSKLRNLLKVKKGIKLSDNVLKKLICEELNKQLYKEFKNRIRYNKPKELKDYITNFIEIYGDEYDISYLKRLLKEDGFNLSNIQLSTAITKVKKELDILYFEKKLSSNCRPVSMWDLELMTGHDFEHFLKTLFEKMGYKVELTKLSNDQGADLIVSKFGEKTVIQAKRYVNKVGNKAVQEAVASIKYYGADRGMVVTTSKFTRPAIKLANANNIELIDGSKLEDLIQKYL